MNLYLRLVYFTGHHPCCNVLVLTLFLRLSNIPFHDHAMQCSLPRSCKLCLALHALLTESQTQYCIPDIAPDKADGQSHLRDGSQPPFPSLPSLFLSLVPRLTTPSISIGGLLNQRLAIFRRNTKLPPFVAEKGQRAKGTSFSVQSHTSAALAARSSSKGPQEQDR